MEPVLDYATPTSTAGEKLPPRKSFDWLNIILQIGHRATALALFVVLITFAAIKTKYLEPHPMARIAFILSYSQVPRVNVGVEPGGLSSDP